MKSHAICVNNHNHTQKTISAFEAFLLREENHREYKNLTFYYKIISEEYKVFPKYNNSTQTAYFAFYSHNTNLASNEAEGESLTHYVVKRALANLSTIHLKNDYRDIDLLIKTTKSEYEKTFGFTDTFRADVYYEFDKNQPSKKSREYFYKWNGKLVIEVYVTHKTNFNKCNTFEKNGIPIFEVNITEGIRNKIESNKSNASINSDIINKLISETQNIFSKQIFGNLISNPSSKGYIEMCQYHQEIKYLKSKKENEQNELNKLIAEIDSKKDELKLIDSKINYYEENKQLSIRNLELEKENKKLQDQLNAHSEHPVKEMFKTIIKRFKN